VGHEVEGCSIHQKQQEITNRHRSRHAQRDAPRTVETCDRLPIVELRDWQRRHLRSWGRGEGGGGGCCAVVGGVKWAAGDALAALPPCSGVPASWGGRPPFCCPAEPAVAAS